MKGKSRVRGGRRRVIPKRERWHKRCHRFQAIATTGRDSRNRRVRPPFNHKSKQTEKEEKDWLDTGLRKRGGPTHKMVSVRRLVL